MTFLKLEDKFKKWIENNRIKWCFVLFGLGLILGLGSNLLLEGSIIQGFNMGFAYSFILVIVEISAGGSGID